MPRRKLVLVGAVAVLGIVPVLIVAALQVSQPPERGPSPVERRLAIGGAALSSPVDPEAKFYWELGERPRALIDLDELISGGPPPDGIPAIDAPQFETVAQASRWLSPSEPVLSFERSGIARAYPVQILTWHEIVNDAIGNEPFAVTFCPLCNSAIVFDRRAGDRVLDFGTSGKLYRSDLVMYDRQTKSLWPQFTGQAVVGPLIGARLEMLPSSMVSWDEWRGAHPDGQVLSRITGHSRDYGRNPYAGYDSPGNAPFLFRGESDPRLDAVERVVAVELGDETKAYPFRELARMAPAAVHDRVGGTDIVVLFELGTASALDTSEIARGRDVGASGVFRPMAQGRPVTIEVRDGAFVDRETGSRWNLLGKAEAGPLEGVQLEGVTHVDTFWFAWAVFKPETTIWRR